jgi:hypothetical protein
MKRRSLFAALAVAAAVGACAPQQMGQPVFVQPVACDTSFTVVNNSSVTVAQLYFSSTARNDWGVDQLGTSVLPPGRFVNYRAANPGGYDFRVRWTNGRVAELRNVNICAASRITVTNAGLFAS